MVQGNIVLTAAAKNKTSATVCDHIIGVLMTQPYKTLHRVHVLHAVCFTVN
jgi:hypothetical protein